MLEHGGRLRRASQQYGLPLGSWLDLSTGLNPVPWQGAEPPLNSWARLPEDEDELAPAAQAYYGAPLALPIAGSQAAIQTLPQLRPPGHVGLLATSYAEHHYHWHRAGHRISLLTAAECAAASEELDVLVLVNPNNPTGERFMPEQLAVWHARLVARGGWLVVDEAFADTSPELSLATLCGRDGLIVLRSLGKFFGLAGARVGFALAAAPLLHSLAERLGPWSLAGPSRFVATQALSDRPWQEATRRRLAADGQRLHRLLARCGLSPSGGTSLFQWVLTPQAAWIHDRLARSGILVRLFETPSSLRFGLPYAAEDWERLEGCLRALRLAEPMAHASRATAASPS
jgi:cobalamin biosynthetic protein CobC